MNEIERIELFFDPDKENIDWFPRETRTCITTVVSEKNRASKNSSLYISGKAIVYVHCDYCGEKIENNEYSLHLQSEHPEKYALIQAKKIIQTNPHHKLTKSEKKARNLFLNETIETQKNINSPKKDLEKKKYKSNGSITFSTISKNNLSKVFSKDLVDVKTINCPFCQYNFSPDTKTFIQHLKQYHNNDLYNVVYGDGDLLKCKSCKAVLNGCHPLVIVKHITRNCFMQNSKNSISVETDINQILEQFYFQTTPKAGQGEDVNEKKASFSQRGLEIQTRLQELRDEIKHNASLQVQRENIRNELLRLQKEMNDNPEKFNKIDNINIRLAQIDDYLDKLKRLDEKEKIIDSSSKREDYPLACVKIDEPKSEKSSKKRPMKTIWKHSLS